MILDILCQTIINIVRNATNITTYSSLQLFYNHFKIIIETHTRSVYVIYKHLQSIFLCYNYFIYTL